MIEGPYTLNGGIEYYRDEASKALDLQFRLETNSGSIRRIPQNMLLLLIPFFEASRDTGHIVGFNRGMYVRFATERFGSDDDFPKKLTDAVLSSGLLRKEETRGIYFPTEVAL